MKTTKTSLTVLTWLLLGGLLQSGALAAQDLAGNSEWGNEITLSTTASGLVSQVHVSVGDRVERGALLLELDPRNYKTRLAAAVSRWTEQRLLHEEAKRELERALELYDRTMLSEHDRQLAEIEAAKADAALRTAEMELTRARLQRDYSRIKAPIDGRVAEIHVQPGQAVVNRFQAAPLVTLVDHRRMLARTQVDEKTLPRLKVGDKVQIGVRGVWLDGEIAAIGYNPVNRTAEAASYRLDAAFTPGEQMGLRSGEKLVIRLPHE